jgi:ankyrin repeat protein
MLVDSGAKADIQDIQGNTAVHIICELSRTDIMRVFNYSEINRASQLKNKEGKIPQSLARNHEMISFFT